jgi:site-specific recombinase XerD
VIKRTIHNKLTLYRRHAGGCPIQDSSDLQNCECPLWVHGRVRGKFIRISLDTRSVMAALQKCDDLLAAKPDDDPSGGGLRLVGAPSADVTLKQTATDFLASKTGKSKSLMKLYTRALRDFLPFAERARLTLLREIDHSHIDRYITECRAREGHRGKWTRNTAQGRLKQLRIFFNYCVSSRWITHSPAAGRDLNVPKSNGPTTDRLPFQPTEVTEILRAVERLPEGERDRARALILLMLYSGTRISDATFFERDYLTERSTADYWVIKTRRPISLPPELQPPAVDALKKLPASRVYFFWGDRTDNYREIRQGLRNGEDFRALMPDYEARVRKMTKLVGKVLKLAGIGGACHRFRDTFAVNLLVSGADVYTVSKMLGHSDLKTTERYLKLVPGYRERMSQATRLLTYQFPLAG